MKQDGRVYLRIPEAEKALWEEQATLCGYKSLSDWIRVRCDVSRGDEVLDGVEAPMVVSKPVTVQPVLHHGPATPKRVDYAYTGHTNRLCGRLMFAYIENGEEHWTATPPEGL